MSQVNVSIDEAEVMNIHEFCSSKGYGIDINVAAKSDTCTVYLQIVLYDSRAREAYSTIHAGDILQKVTGVLKVKSYVKSDHTTGMSLVIENPGPLYPTANKTPQTPQDGPASNVSQPAVNQTVDPWDIIEAESAKEQQTIVQSEPARPYYAPKTYTFTMDGRTYEAYEDDDPF